MMQTTTTIPQVSLSSMNDIHYEEVLLIEKLLEEIKQERSPETLSVSFDAILEHMQAHFASEEMMMQEAQYPSFRMHKADHDKILQETRYAEMEWRNRKDVDALKEYFEEEIITWLDQHIKAMDTPTSDFLMQFERYKAF